MYAGFSDYKTAKANMAQALKGVCLGKLRTDARLVATLWRECSQQAGSVK